MRLHVLPALRHHVHRAIQQGLQLIPQPTQVQQLKASPNNLRFKVEP